MKILSTTGQKTRKGMTLVETVIAIGVISLCISGVCRVMTIGTELSGRARDHYVAVTLAKNRLETANALGFEQLAFLTESRVVLDVTGAPTSRGNYRRTTSVTNAGVNLVEVIVSVDIRNRESLAFSGEKEEIRSYFTRYVEP